MAPPKGFKPSKPFLKGNPGRPVGVKNKVTQSIREAFLEAFEMRGGANALYQWSLGEPTEFYKLASRLIPQELTGANGGPLLGVVVLPPLGAAPPSPDALSASLAAESGTGALLPYPPPIGTLRGATDAGEPLEVTPEPLEPLERIEWEPDSLSDHG